MGGRRGKRAGAGRPKGSRNRRSLLGEIMPNLAPADLELPLYRLLRRIADPTLDDRYRDMLSIATLPFLHARVPATMTAKPVFMMTDEELQEVTEAQREHERQTAISRGQVRLVKPDG